MNALILKDKEVFPTDEVLENALKSSYPAFNKLRDELTATDVRIEWNYYNDGKPGWQDVIQKEEPGMATNIRRLLHHFLLLHGKASRSDRWIGYYRKYQNKLLSAKAQWQVDANDGKYPYGGRH